MSSELKKSLDRLHEKQDQQTEKISALEVTVAKQEVNMDSYMRQSDRMAAELAKLNENMAVYNAELKTHIAGVLELKEMNRLTKEEIKQRDIIINERLIIAEKPITWLIATWNFLKGAAPIIAAIAAIVTIILKITGVIKL
jgi:uncharacterized coiled-coil protein SlyX